LPHFTKSQAGKIGKEAGKDALTTRDQGKCANELFKKLHGAGLRSSDEAASACDLLHKRFFMAGVVCF
jgi:hypothetical protein